MDTSIVKAKIAEFYRCDCIVGEIAFFVMLMCVLMIHDSDWNIFSVICKLLDKYIKKKSIKYFL